MNKNKIEILNDFAIVKIGNSEVIIDIEDIEKISEYRWCINKDGYAVNGHNNIYLHVLVYGRKDGFVIDHADQNKLNNKKSNLRYVSKSLNSINSKMNKNNKTGYKGVFFYKRKGKYIAYLTIDKKRINFGYFTNLEDALIARLKGEAKYFKDNAPQKDLFEKYGIKVDVNE
jgi:HNH endonuclease